MTDNVKVISRPKVRFRQFSNDPAQSMEEVVEHDKEQAVLRANGPRIKEIVSLKKSIRIVDPRKQQQSTSVADREISVSNCNIDASSHYDDIRNMSLSDKNMPKIEGSAMIPRDVNATIRNAKKKCKISQLDKSSEDDALKNCAKSLRRKGKENKGVPLKRATSSKNISETRTENSQHESFIREKFKLSTDTKSNCMQKVNIQDFNRPKMTKSQSAPSIMKKTRNSMIEGRIFNAKPSTSCLMSHYKVVAKNKIYPVKKIILRNVTGPKIKTSVEPGVFRKEQDTAMTSDANERRVVKLDVTVQDLAQPEYNSIICTINKLKEVKQQKIVTDISHLPSALKTFLNGKVNIYYINCSYIYI